MSNVSIILYTVKRDRVLCITPRIYTILSSSLRFKGIRHNYSKCKTMHTVSMKKINERTLHFDKLYISYCKTYLTLFGDNE